MKVKLVFSARAISHWDSDLEVFAEEVVNTDGGASRTVKERAEDLDSFFIAKNATPLRPEPVEAPQPKQRKPSPKASPKPSPSPVKKPVARKKSPAAARSPASAKKKSPSSKKSPSPTKRHVKKALLDLAEEFRTSGGVISHAEAKQLWLKAEDGTGVTEMEFATLRHILDEYKFTKKARSYLDPLAHKRVSGTSLYKTIAGVKYDRSCMDMAEHLAKDGSLSLPDARLLWAEVEDGPGVTETEKRTVVWAMENYRCTKGAKKFFQDHLAQWESPTKKSPVAKAKRGASTPGPKVAKRAPAKARPATAVKAPPPSVGRSGRVRKSRSFLTYDHVEPTPRKRSKKPVEEVEAAEVEDSEADPFNFSD